MSTASTPSHRATVIPEGPPTLPPRSPTPQSVPAPDPWALQAAYQPLGSTLRFSTDLGVPPVEHSAARPPPPHAPPPHAPLPPADVQAAGADLRDRLQWHGLQSFMADANKPQPLAPAMGRAPPPKNVPMREAKMQQQGW